jgi:hypothetical protein
MHEHKTLGHPCPGDCDEFPELLADFGQIVSQMEQILRKQGKIT